MEERLRLEKTLSRELREEAGLATAACIAPLPHISTSSSLALKLPSFLDADFQVNPGWQWLNTGCYRLAVKAYDSATDVYSNFPQGIDLIVAVVIIVGAAKICCEDLFSGRLKLTSEIFKEIDIELYSYASLWSRRGRPRIAVKL